MIPLGLAGWAAFSFSFVFANMSYVWPVLSDPLGWGWNLVGTADVPWRPYLAGTVPFLQAGSLLIGVLAACRVARGIAGQLLGEGTPSGAAVRLGLPVAGFCAIVAVALLVLLIG